MPLQLSIIIAVISSKPTEDTWAKYKYNDDNPYPFTTISK